MKKVLVLGANGFLGSCLVKELLKNNEVIGYDAPGRKSLFTESGYTHISRNYCEETDFADILCTYKISAVYHMICTSVPKEGTMHIEAEIKQNVIPTVRLLNAAAECRVERVIFPSSGGTVYGDGNENTPHGEREALSPICSYGVQKMTIEGYLRLFRHMHGLKTIVARLANPYGPCMQKGRTQGIVPILIGKLLNGEGIDLYGETIRDYLYIDDAIDAMIRLLDYEGEETVFNIGSGEGVSLRDLTGRIEAVVGRRFSAVNQMQKRSCDVSVNVLDISKAVSELGWRPLVPLNEGVRRTYRVMGCE